MLPKGQNWRPSYGYYRKAKSLREKVKRYTPLAPIKTHLPLSTGSAPNHRPWGRHGLGRGSSFFFPVNVTVDGNAAAYTATWGIEAPPPGQRIRQKGLTPTLVDRLRGIWPTTNDQKRPQTYPRDTIQARGKRMTHHTAYPTRQEGEGLNEGAI